MVCALSLVWWVREEEMVGENMDTTSHHNYTHNDNNNEEEEDTCEPLTTSATLTSVSLCSVATTLLTTH